jgi:epoxyqueuosine reductase
MRPLIGNRIFGCDDCQLVCPWNRYTPTTTEADFQPRHQLDQADLIELFNWNEEVFLTRTEGSPIRRTGYEGWLRNLAVALGNSNGGERAISALKAKQQHASALVREHVNWAIDRLQQNAPASPLPLTELYGRKLKHLMISPVTPKDG